ncbi:hypothetical protein ACKI16_48295, partial [Streptomyces scabiei]|uniref:hypothetical protein n=1 Tax=Streptomyces scabiei TaxID=1930 RepID=UPI0038F77FDB
MFNATDGARSLNVTQYQALVAASITLTGANTVPLLDTAAHLAALSTADLSALASNGIDLIRASDGLSLTAA